MRDPVAGGAWICCQIGAREHYSIPRALLRNRRLGGLFVDAWPTGLWNHLPIQQWKDRYHPELADFNVWAPNARTLAREVRMTINRLSPWERIMARNRWFQSAARRSIRARLRELGPASVLFSYSYAGLDLLHEAKEMGCRTVLGQIDPGPEEERIVARITKDCAHLEPRWDPAPAEYWRLWRLECEAADVILVNSEWSRRALIREGIEGVRIRVVPLVYEPPAGALGFQRMYPRSFSKARPLRVLFLGQVNVRKGIHILIDAIRLLNGEPVEFAIVGPLQISVPADMKTRGNVKWTGPVPRSEAATYYQWADVFVFPTFSDGFGLTQLEAQAWKAPLITSAYCGEVVDHGRNGIVLDKLDGPSLAAVLAGYVGHAEELTSMSAQSTSEGQYSIYELSRHLAALTEAAQRQ